MRSRFGCLEAPDVRRKQEACGRESLLDGRLNPPEASALPDGVRLVIAERDIAGLRKDVADIREGQAIITETIIGGVDKRQGIVRDGMAQDVVGLKRDMGDLKSGQVEHAKKQAAIEKKVDAQADQLERIVSLGKKALLYLGRGIGGLVTVGALHLVTLWWSALAAAFGATLQHMSAVAQAAQSAGIAH